MKRHTLIATVAAVLVVSSYAAAPSLSPHAGQEARGIKALSADEVNELLAE